MYEQKCIKIRGVRLWTSPLNTQRLSKSGSCSNHFLFGLISGFFHSTHTVFELMTKRKYTKQNDSGSKRSKNTEDDDVATTRKITQSRSDDELSIPPSNPAATAESDEEVEEAEEDEDDDSNDISTATTASKTDDKALLKLLLSSFSTTQMTRYETFRRANLNKNGIKKLANSVLNQSITGNVAVALSGLSKIFVGEVIEKARELRTIQNATKKEESTSSNSQTEQQESPLRPDELRNAIRILRQENKFVNFNIPNAQWRRQGGFEGDGKMFR